MSSKKIWSYAASLILFLATGILVLLVLRLDTAGQGITNGEFVPMRNCMFAVAVPCFIKFYISCDKEYKEDRRWLIGYGLCFAAWALFLAYVYALPYFTNIRTMCLASFVLMCVAVYLEYGIIEK